MDKFQQEQEKCVVMLGQIATLVQEFCDEDETTLQGVAKLLAHYRDSQAKEAWDFVDSLSTKNKI
jgi:hypothetical protein